MYVLVTWRAGGVWRGETEALGLEGACEVALGRDFRELPAYE